MATNVVVQDGCEQNLSEHVAVADPRAPDYVLNALDPGNPRQPRCEASAPIHDPRESEYLRVWEPLDIEVGSHRY